MFTHNHVFFTFKFAKPQRYKQRFTNNDECSHKTETTNIQSYLQVGENIHFNYKLVLKLIASTWYITLTEDPSAFRSYHANLMTCRGLKLQVNFKFVTIGVSAMSLTT